MVEPCCIQNWIFRVMITPITYITVIFQFGRNHQLNQRQKQVDSRVTVTFMQRVPKMFCVDQKQSEFKKFQQKQCHHSQW